jgi:hypothetical protein
LICAEQLERVKFSFLKSWPSLIRGEIACYHCFTALMQLPMRTRFLACSTSVVEADSLPPAILGWFTEFECLE